MHRAVRRGPGEWGSRPVHHINRGRLVAPHAHPSHKANAAGAATLECRVARPLRRSPLCARIFIIRELAARAANVAQFAQLVRIARLIEKALANKPLLPGQGVLAALEANALKGAKAIVTGIVAGGGIGAQ